MRSVSFNGITYSNMREACNELDLDYGYVMGVRHYAHLTREEALEKAVQAGKQNHSRNSRAILFRGMEFKNLIEACEHYGLSLNAVREQKRRKEMTNAEVLAYCLEKGRASLDGRFEFQGNRYASLKEACELNDVRYRTVADRKRREGISGVEALAKQLSKRVQFKGKTYDTLEAACRDWGVNAPKVRERSTNCGISKTEALAFYVQQQMSTDKASAKSEKEQ